MGKGKGKKLLKRLFPIRPGQFFMEAKLNRRSFKYLKKSTKLLKKAAKKFNVYMRLSFSDL